MKNENTKITQEREQFRTTIPKKLMQESGKNKGDIVEWKNKKGKLSASVISHEEFMKKVEEETSHPAQVKKAMKCKHCDGTTKCNFCGSKGSKFGARKE